MRAIVVREFGGPDVLRHEDWPDPEPRPDDVVVDVAVAGINLMDCYLRQGEVIRMNLPYIPGVDGTGVVTGVGTNVRHLQLGDRVAWRRVGSSYAEATAVAWQTTPTAVGGHDGKQTSLITHRIDRSDRGEAIPAS